MKKLIYLILLISFQKLSSQCFPDRHSTNWYDGWISCQSKQSPNKKNGKGHWILYDFGNYYKIDKWKIWNTNDPAHLDWGVKNIKIEYSVDKKTWTDVGIFNIEKASGNNQYEGMDWKDITIPGARYMLVTAVDNFKGSCYGFSEIRFSAEKVNIEFKLEDRAADQNLEISISPNPFEYETDIEIQSDVPGPAQYYISNITGQKISSGNFTMDKNFYHLIINSRHWDAGIYTIFIQRGDKIIQKSLVKI